MKNFSKKIQAQFNKMVKTGKLFRVTLTGQQVWDLYMASFDNDPIFRDPLSSEHNCNHCKNFLRRYGNIVSIDSDNKIVSMFDVDMTGTEYEKTAKDLSKAICSSKIQDVFFETFNELNSLPYEVCKHSQSTFQLGIVKNVKRYTKEEAEKYGVVKPNEIREFDHMHLSIPAEFVDASGKSEAQILAEYRDAKEVFKRGLDEIPEDTLKLVRDLINQESLLDGKTHLHKIEKLLPLKLIYDGLPKSEQDNWAWVNSYKLPIAKFKNELLGVLCTELAQGEELNKACSSWNKRVDPVNYMKAVAPLTEAMKKAAIKEYTSLGYEETDLERRFANIDDINVSEILHANAGDGTIKKVSVFDSVKTAPTRHKRSEFDGLEIIPIDKFMKDILPSVTTIEAFLANEHEGNMVTMTTAVHADGKNLLKWDNPYSWTFNGNIAGKSQIKQAVKTAGGNVTGVLRFSMMWADGNGDNSDLDLHCKEPNQTEIYFSNKRSSITGGNLDVDITQPNGKLAVENIIFPSLERMTPGVYKLFVHQFAARGSKGFAAEIEMNGTIYSYEYKQAVGDKKDVHVAEVTVSKDKTLSINHILPEIGVSSKDIYGLPSNEFHKVNLVCLSPNHWGTNAVGNKHFFFMLEGAKTPESIRGFHAENLNAELYASRKFLDVLSGKIMIIPGSGKELSGLGFNATVRDEVILKLGGSHKRMVKVIF